MSESTPLNTVKHDDDTDTSDYWTVTVKQTMPDCPSCREAWEKLASPTKMKEWRSSDFAKLPMTLVSPDTTMEPLKTNDEYKIRMGPFTSTVTVIESTAPEDDDSEGIIDSLGTSSCGLVRARLRFSICKGADGVVTVGAQEMQAGACSCLFPPKEKVEGEHRTMIQELNDTFKSS